MGLLPAQIPFGFDRANGGAFGGTATPSNARVYSPSNLIFEELPDSPRWNLAEQATVVHTFKVDPVQTGMLQNTYIRGNIYTDNEGVQWRVLSVDINYNKGDYNIVSVTSEGINIYIPQPEYSIEEVDINPAAQKHPRYAPLNQTFGTMVTPSGGGSPVFTLGVFSPIAEVELGVQQLSSGQGGTSSSALNDLQTLTNFGTTAYNNGDLIAQQSALELLKKLRRGQTNFYLPGYKVSYSTYFPLQTAGGNNAPDLDMGGRLDDPTGNPISYYQNGSLITVANQSQVIIPPEFWTDSSGNNIYTQLAKTLSQQFYGNGVSWFRQADGLEYQRTWLRRTSTWLMGPAGGPITLSSNDNSQTTTYQWTGQWDVQWYSPLAPLALHYPPFDF